MPAIETYVRALTATMAGGDATEHSHRPALKTWLESFEKDLVATNEPKRSDAGAPDYDVKTKRRHGWLSVGKIEAKDVGVDLDKIQKDSDRHAPRTREGTQLQRYRGAFPNLILTDYVEFRWYLHGDLKLVAALGSVERGEIVVSEDGPQRVGGLIAGFLGQSPQKVRTARVLAEKMAGLAAVIHDVVRQATENDTLTDATKGLKTAFRDTLVADLTDDQFADMLAQTVAYGLFAARVQKRDENDPFTRQGAAKFIPRTNPFLRGLFAYITGPELDDEPHAGIVDDLAQLLNDTDIDRVLRNFGAEKRDPIVHFYETFLGTYNPELRDIRGVYYTPLPVVSYIVASVDHLLKVAFSLQDGVADTSKTEDGSGHRVLVLDPATGTGTFLYETVDRIRKTFVNKGKTGMWPSYVREHLLPRLFGFELMMAPYAVAHLKLALQLAGQDLPEDEREDIAYDFATDERVGIYLTNALDPGEAHSTLALGKFLSDEANAASAVKTDMPIMVVIGNPPYQGQSANTSQRRVRSRVVNGIQQYRTIKTAIGELLDAYYHVDGKPLGEQNPKWLQDDYVKFIRLGQSRIDSTGHGILAYVTNHTYLDAPTFRGMRQSLLTSFDEIYVLDLHGSTRRREKNPDGSADENVFDQIQQGVCVTVFVKTTGSAELAKVHYADLWGTRKAKYEWLDGHTVGDTVWDDVVPVSPFYSLRPSDAATREEWDAAPGLTEIFPLFSTGVVTHRDEFAIDTRESRLRSRLEDFCDQGESDATTRAKYFGTKSRTTPGGITYAAGDNRDWSMAQRRPALVADAGRADSIRPIAYRPFDNRYVIYHRDAVDSLKHEVMRHMLEADNLGLVSARSNKSGTQDQFFVVDQMIEVKAGEATTGSVLFPLWLHPDKGPEGGMGDTLDIEYARGGRKPNVGPKAAAILSEKLELTLLLEKDHGDFDTTVGPRDLLDYTYAVVHSRAYRVRYGDFLRSDYAHIPFTSDRDLFKLLCGLGHHLVELHILKSGGLDDGPARAPTKGSDIVERIPVSQRWEPGETADASGAILLNREGGKSGAPQTLPNVDADVWQFQVGGHHVLHKWLEARNGDRLTYEEIQHLVRVVNAIRSTLDVQERIEEALSEWPIT